MVHTLTHLFKKGKIADERAAQEISDRLDAFEKLKTANEILDFCKKHLSFCKDYKEYVLGQARKFQRSGFATVSKIPYVEDLPTLIGSGKKRKRKTRRVSSKKKFSKKRKSVKKVTRKRRRLW